MNGTGTQKTPAHVPMLPKGRHRKVCPDSPIRPEKREMVHNETQWDMLRHKKGVPVPPFQPFLKHIRNQNDSEVATDVYHSELTLPFRAQRRI